MLPVARSSRMPIGRFSAVDQAPVLVAAILFLDPTCPYSTIPTLYSPRSGEGGTPPAEFTGPRVGGLPQPQPFLPVLAMAQPGEDQRGYIFEHDGGTRRPALPSRSAPLSFRRPVRSGQSPEARTRRPRHELKPADAAGLGFPEAGQPQPLRSTAVHMPLPGGPVAAVAGERQLHYGQGRPAQGLPRPQLGVRCDGW